MSRRPPSDPDEYSGTPETLSRKKVLETIRRRQSLAGADLRGEDLSEVNFDNVDLSRAKLAEANLAGCSFRGANLSGASLWQANLQGAVLDDANLENADLDFANLDGVTIRGARIKKTIFPIHRLSLDVIHDAVKTGARLRMEHTRAETD